MRKFIALKTFFSTETRSEYVEGLTYTVRDGERWDTLRSLVDGWAQEGKISFDVPEQSGGLEGGI